MASSRIMRKSPRNASPMNSATSTAPRPVARTSSGNLEVQKDGNYDIGGEDWVEPTLRTPAPSFEDHRGLERHGVLEQMAPLGTMPNQKVRLRVKQWEPPRSMQTVKRASVDIRADSAVGVREKEASKTSEIPEKRLRSSESHRAEEQRPPPMRQHSLRERERGDEDQDYSPKLSTRPTSSRSTTAPRTNNNPHSAAGTPNSNTAQGREILRKVVESAVERSRELGNEILGLAIRKLFDDSLHDMALADLLNAVLSQNQTVRQASDFQAHIKVARKQIKLNGQLAPSVPPATGATSSSSKSLSKSPSKRSRRSTSHNINQNSNDQYEMGTPTKASRHHANGTNKSHNPNGPNDSDPPPAKRIKRSGSVSSTSTLSSTHSLDLEVDLPETDDPSLPSLRHTRGSSGPRLHTFSTSGKHDSSGEKKRLSTHPSAAVSGAGNVKEDQVTAELVSKKRAFQRSFSDYVVNESELRADPSPSQRPLHLNKNAVFPKLQTPLSTRSRKEEEAGYDDLASPASSFQGEFLVPPPPGALRANTRSRGGTPNALGRPRKEKEKEVRRTARVKMSPMKKKNGVIAGVSRGNRTLRERERENDALMENASDSESDANQDFCTSCGGNGELLCCDGCIRSFHFRCLDPPVNPVQPPDGEWFCYICESKRDPQARLPRGLFSALDHRLGKQNPVAFSLSDYEREYFEGVRVGEDGEYEDASTVKPKLARGLGHDNLDADNFKLKDSKNHVVLCFNCGLSSLGHREIISCDYCSLKWHLDCLSPPLANPPVRESILNPNRPRQSWMCPAHVDQELMTVGHGGRLHRIRRPRNAKIVDTMLRRGFRNNGIIEIENDASDDEMGSWDGEESVVYRIPERSIKLDFIDRIYKMKAEEARLAAIAEQKAHERAAHEARAARDARIAFNNRSFFEKDTALSLARLAHTSPDSGLGPDQIQALINSLITSAPPHMIRLLAPGIENVEHSNESHNDVADCPTDHGSKLKSTVSNTAGDNSKDAKPGFSDTPLKLGSLRKSTRSSSIRPPTPPVSDTQVCNSANTLGVASDQRQRQAYLLLQELIQQKLSEITGPEEVEEGDQTMETENLDEEESYVRPIIQLGEVMSD